MTWHIFLCSLTWTCSNFETNWRKYFGSFSIKLIFFFPFQSTYPFYIVPLSVNWRYFTLWNRSGLGQQIAGDCSIKYESTEIWPWGCEERLQRQHTQVSSPPHLTVTRGPPSPVSFWESGRMMSTKGQQGNTTPSTSQDAPEPRSSEMLPFSAVSSHPVHQAFHSHRGNLWWKWKWVGGFSGE